MIGEFFVEGFEMRSIPKSILFLLMVVLVAPISAQAQDPTITPTPSTVSLRVDFPPDQILGTDNPIDLGVIAKACDPDCGIGSEVVFYVDQSFRVDQSMAILIVSSKEPVSFTVPDKMIAVILDSGSGFAYQGIAGDTFFLESLHMTIIVPEGTEELSLATDVVVFDPAFCQPYELAKKDQIVAYSQDEWTWVMQMSPVTIPSLCDRVWAFDRLRGPVL